MRPFLFALMMVLSFFSVSQAAPKVPSDIKNVRIVVYNTAPEGVRRAFFRMLVYINNEKTANYLVSPGRNHPASHSMATPEGIFHTTTLKVMHYSSQSDSSIFYQGDPMPFSIFFYQGFALHGSYGAIDGQALSHGCVRLKYDDAKELFGWVKKAVENYGRKSVTIEIYDTQNNPLS